ncbi:hypothetical protein HZA38_04575 [Candidatus Peregrinibacteria bacterium]|nr:hypothetical protein [Candidatus Peregrinibacteria bacterium]
MFSQKRTILWLFLLIFVLAGTFAWNLWIYKGTLSISTNVQPFTIDVKSLNKTSGEHFLCGVSACNVDLSPGKYQMTIQKEGYFSSTQNIEVFWRAPNSFEISLSRIPVLSTFPEMPTNWKNPDQENISQKYSISNSGEIRQKDGEKSSLLAILELGDEVQNARIFPDEAQHRLFVLTPKELYEVSILEKRKYRIFFSEEKEVLTDLQVFKGDILLIKSNIGKESRSFFFVPSLRRVLPLEENPQIHLICQNPEKFTELYYLISNGTNWLLKKIITTDSNISGLASHEFPSAPLEIQCGSPHEILGKTENQYFRFEI